jgi:UDP-glucose 4-epimerase
MKILVTGGAGFIGSHIVDNYIENGNDVVVIDNLSTGDRHQVNQKAKFYQCDINSIEMDTIFAYEQPEIVNHHAAQISVPYSVENPLIDAQTNVLGMLNLLECCRKYKVKKVIFASSGGAIYGEAKEIPTPETYIPNPQSPYAIHKLMGEKYLAFYYVTYGLQFTVLRYANVYGPRQIPSSEAGVVSKFINQILRNEKPTVFIYEDDPEGMSRDYVNVNDVVQANLVALDKGEGEIVNIGTGIMTKTRHLLKEIADIMKMTVNPEIQAPRPGDIRFNSLNNEKAKLILGWYPTLSLRNGLPETIEYFAKRHEEVR